MDLHGPVPIRFEWNDRETLMHLGDHAAHWANYLGELVRELPMHYLSWRQVPTERKAGVLIKIGTRFDLKPHIESERWPKIYTGIQQHLQKIYNGNKLPFGMIPRTLPGVLKIAKTGQRARSYAGMDPDGELRYSRVPVADPDLLPDTYCWRGGDVEATGSMLQHRDGCALHRIGDHSHCSKGQALRASSWCWSDDKMSQVLTQLESLPEFGSGSGCEDDEPGDDEDGDENEEKLLRLVKLHGERKWAHIAEQMIDRAGKQCRERWHNHLRPDIKKDIWSEDEERLLVEVHRKVGNKWAEIAKLIPGRTDNSIKNHWNTTKRRQISRRCDSPVGWVSA
ncbi:transcription factor MYB119-like protein [Tanacetum coccineum]